MPYPLVHAPTFAEFRQRLEKEFGCQFKIDGGITYFERMIGDEAIRCVVDIEDESKRILLSVVGRICRQLKISPQHFGLTLEGFPPE